MNKCYFGNFQDFCKYGLLRELAKFADSHKFNLHFCQMITADDDSRIRSEEDFSYLQNDVLARYDKDLFCRLKRWHGKPPRGPYQWARESARIVVLAKHNNKLLPKEEVARKNYFGETIAAAKRGDVIFFNPDYGLAFADRMLKENAPLSQGGRDWRLRQKRRLRFVLSGDAFSEGEERRRTFIPRCLAPPSRRRHSLPPVFFRVARAVIHGAEQNRRRRILLGCACRTDSCRQGGVVRERI